jgi:hypothetical protein
MGSKNYSPVTQELGFPGRSNFRDEVSWRSRDLLQYKRVKGLNKGLSFGFTENFAANFPMPEST